MAAAFIAAIITVGLYFANNQSAEEKLFASYYKADPGLATVMSVSDNYEFERAMVDYKTGNYSEALARWEKLAKENTMSDTLQYFIGSAYLAHNNPSAAVVYFDKVTAKPKSTFTDDAYWYKGMALL